MQDSAKLMETGRGKGGQQKEIRCESSWLTRSYSSVKETKAQRELEKGSR